MSLKPFNSVGGVSVGEVPINIIDAAGNIANVSSLTATSIAGNITTASQPNITSVGTLTSLAVTGNASAGNLSTTGSLSVTGNASVGNLSATRISGTLSTAAQPNITSVGTLTSLAVTGNVTANYFIGNGSQLTSLSTVYGYEIHVSSISGNDTTGDGTLLYPVATITKALTLLNTNVKTIIVHP
jgi:hypothetical protein